MTLSFAIKALGKAPKSDVIFPSCGPHGVVRKVSEGSGEEAAVSLGGKQELALGGWAGGLDAHVGSDSDLRR